MLDKESREKVTISPGQMVLVMVFVMYKTYIFVYAGTELEMIPPYVWLLIDVSQFIIAMFIGKKVGVRVNDIVMEQIEIMINPELSDDRRVSMLERLLKWILVDINKYYDKHYDKFRKHMQKKGYADLKIDMNPEGAET